MQWGKGQSENTLMTSVPVPTAGNMGKVLKSWNQQICVLLFCCTLSDRIFLRSPAVMMANPLSAADTPPKRVYTSLKTPTNFDVKVIQGSSKVRCLFEQR